MKIQGDDTQLVVSGIGASSFKASASQITAKPSSFFLYCPHCGIWLDSDRSALLPSPERKEEPQWPLPVNLVALLANPSKAHMNFSDRKTGSEKGINLPKVAQHGSRRAGWECRSRN